MKKFFKSIIFLIILVLSFQYYEEKIFKKFDAFVDYAYYKIPKNSIDLLFIGSSHSYCTFNSRLFDHYLKCNSLNLGTNSQTFPATYSAILEVLKKQTPKVIVIEVFRKKYEKICFLDNGHLSLAGSDDVSFEMAQFLKENYPTLLNTKNYELYEKSNRIFSTLKI